MLASILRKVDRLCAAQKSMVPLSQIIDNQDELMAAIRSIKKSDKRKSLDNYKVVHIHQNY